MVRVKLPVRLGITPEQLGDDGAVSVRHVLAWVGVTSPRGRTSSSTSSSSTKVPDGHPPVGFKVGLTTREACSDTVRNVMGCHLAGRVPVRVARHQRRGPRPRTSHFLRNPISPAAAAQVQDQLLGLHHRLRPGDVQRHRRGRGVAHARRRHHRTRFPRVHRGRARRERRTLRIALEEFTAREDLHGHASKPVVRTFEQDRQPRQQAAGAHEVARRHSSAWEEVQRRVLQGTTQVLAGVVVVARWHSRPSVRRDGRHARRSRADEGHAHVTDVGQGVRRSRSVAVGRRTSAGRRRERGPRACAQRHACRPRRGRRAGRPVTVAAAACARRDPTRATTCRSVLTVEPPEPRVPRAAAKTTCRRSTRVSPRSAWPRPGAELVARRRVVPRCRHVQPRGHAVARLGQGHR